MSSYLPFLPCTILLLSKMPIFGHAYIHIYCFTTSMKLHKCNKCCCCCFCYKLSFFFKTHTISKAWYFQSRFDKRQEDPWSLHKHAGRPTSGHLLADIGHERLRLPLQAFSPLLDKLVKLGCHTTFHLRLIQLQTAEKVLETVLPLCHRLHMWIHRTINALLD